MALVRSFITLLIKTADLLTSFTLNCRPIDGLSRVTPDALRLYRFTSQMLGPCCLCPLIDPTSPDFVEAAIHIPTSGTHAGEYVASCEKDRCDYMGEFHYPVSAAGLFYSILLD